MHCLKSPIYRTVKQWITTCPWTGGLSLLVRDVRQSKSFSCTRCTMIIHLGSYHEMLRVCSLASRVASERLQRSCNAADYASSEVWSTSSCVCPLSSKIGHGTVPYQGRGGGCNLTNPIFHYNLCHVEIS